MLPALTVNSRWAALCVSTRYCTANSASIIPPALCFTSNSPARTGCAARTFWRIAWTSIRSAAASRGALSTAQRDASKRGASGAQPAQKRARVNAWCSQAQAVLLPRPFW